MSNKRYRTPARAQASSVAEAADFANRGRQSHGAQEAAPDRPADAARAALGAADAQLLEVVKGFLGKLVQRATQMIDELPPHPAGDPSINHLRSNRRDEVARVARVGIAACRALMSAMRMTGADTAKVRKLIDETVGRLQQRMERLQPAA